MRKVIPGIKNEAGAYIGPVPPEPTAPEPPPPRPDPVPSDISLDELLGKYYLILYRETRTLLEECSKGKLSKDSAQSVRDNARLIIELKKRENEILAGLTDEQLAELEKARKSPNANDGSNKTRTGAPRKTKSNQPV